MKYRHHLPQLCFKSVNKYMNNPQKHLHEVVQPTDKIDYLTQPRAGLVVLPMLVNAK
jgi:hypothetical protein